MDGVVVTHGAMGALRGTLAGFGRVGAFMLELGGHRFSWPQV
jgi:hypothetical protein